jgi:hypothetical protein
MTARPGVSTAELRATLLLALERAVDALPGGYAALLRDQLRKADVAKDAYGAALFCLGLGLLITGSEEKTLPPATALALLEETGRVFIDLDSEPPGPLVAAWGMPRALNSGDGFYAVAQRALIEDQGLPSEQRLGALRIFSDAARRFAESLHAWAPAGAGGATKASRVLYPAAAAFASLCCGVKDDTAIRLEAIAEELVSQPAATLDGALQKAAALNLRHT